MKAIDLTRRAGRSLGNAKARTLLTSLAIAVGAFTLTLTLAATAGANHYATQLVSSNFDPAVLLVGKDHKLFGPDVSGFDKPQEYDPSSTGVGFGAKTTQYKRLTADDIDRIAAAQGVQAVTPDYAVSPQYVTRQGQKKYAVSVQTYNPGQRPDVGAGVLPSGSDQVARGMILLPESYARVLGFEDNQSAIGQIVTLRLQRPTKLDPAQLKQLVIDRGIQSLSELQQFETRDESFTVVAVTKKPVTAVSPVAYLYISPTDALRLSDFITSGTTDYHKYLTAQVRVVDGTNPTKRTAVKKALEKDGYVVETVEDLQKVLLQVIAILQGIVTGFGVIAVIASVFGIINTQYISVLERTREIGLMKALGMRKSDISWLFRIEAGWIGFLGGIIGVILALVTGTLLNPWLNSTLSLGRGNDLLIFQPLPIIGLVITLMLIAVLAGWMPARRAAKLDPIEALRTE